MKKYLISVLALGAMITNLNAGCGAIGGSLPGVGCLDNTGVKTLYSHAVTTYSTIPNGCGGQYLLLDTSAANYKATYSTILGSILSKNKIYLRTRYVNKGASQRCKVVYAQIFNDQ